jgi:hypothetical protein
VRLSRTGASQKNTDDEPAQSEDDAAWSEAAHWLGRLAACAALGFAVLVAVGYGSGGARGLDAPLAPGTASPIVYGYSYTAACPAAGIADLVDRWALSGCNCTSYVAWALQANRQRID